MQYFVIIAILAIIGQFLFLYAAVRNYRYVFQKLKRRDFNYTPKTALIIPCKGLDATFERNISSFYKLAYEHYILWFVVEEKTDPAYEKLIQLRNRLSSDSKATTFGSELPDVGIADT